MQTRFTLRCIQSGEKCFFICLLAPYPFNKYTFLIKILSYSVKVILFHGIFIPVSIDAKTMKIDQEMQDL